MCAFYLPGLDLEIGCEIDSRFCYFSHLYLQMLYQYVLNNPSSLHLITAYFLSLVEFPCMCKFLSIVLSIILPVLWYPGNCRHIMGFTIWWGHPASFPSWHMPEHLFLFLLSRVGSCQSKSSRSQVASTFLGWKQDLGLVYFPDSLFHLVTLPLTVICLFVIHATNDLTILKVSKIAYRIYLIRQNTGNLFKEDY